jgi:hypothetical protein
MKQQFARRFLLTLAAVHSVSLHGTIAGDNPEGSANYILSVGSI